MELNACDPDLVPRFAQVHDMTTASLQSKWIDAFLRAATGLRSVEYVALSTLQSAALQHCEI